MDAGLYRTAGAKAWAWRPRGFPRWPARAVDRLDGPMCGCDRVRVVAIELERPMGRPSLNEIVLVTDGQIGFESEVIGEIASRLPRSSRVHTVGVGSAVNRTLTGAAARAGARRRGDHRSG